MACDHRSCCLNRLSGDYTGYFDSLSTLISDYFLHLLQVMPGVPKGLGNGQRINALGLPPRIFPAIVSRVRP
jgi:hypothetical protein